MKDLAMHNSKGSKVGRHAIDFESFYSKWSKELEELFVITPDVLDRAGVHVHPGEPGEAISGGNRSEKIIHEEEE